MSEVTLDRTAPRDERGKTGRQKEQTHLDEGDSAYVFAARTLLGIRLGLQRSRTEQVNRHVGLRAPRALVCRERMEQPTASGSDHTALHSRKLLRRAAPGVPYTRETSRSCASGLPRALRQSWLSSPVRCGPAKRAR